jgi:hypothetical protein
LEHFVKSVFLVIMVVGLLAGAMGQAAETATVVKCGPTPCRINDVCSKAYPTSARVKMTLRDTFKKTPRTVYDQECDVDRTACQEVSHV